MDIIMLAAGLSSRMGGRNKLLFPWAETTVACHSCLNALQFLNDEKGGTLIVVTGFEMEKVVKSLSPCNRLLSSKVNMKVVFNPYFAFGQFSSTKKGLTALDENSDFFITLADMPLVTKTHYKELTALLAGHDAVRPFCNSTPGHPVLHKAYLREEMLRYADTYSVREFLSDKDVVCPVFSDKSWVEDMDSYEDYERLRASPKLSSLSG